MSSTNKTDKLKLNQWIASDKPKRTDFNYDNEIIETVISQHMDDTSVHVSEAEREKWDTCVHFGMYFGDGETRRTVATECPFDPVFVLVFANARPFSYANFSEGKKYNYAAFASPISSSSNLSIETDRSISVIQDIAASYQSEYTYLNQSGVAYTYIMFR